MEVTRFVHSALRVNWINLCARSTCKLLTEKRTHQVAYLCVPLQDGLSIFQSINETHTIAINVLLLLLLLQLGELAVRSRHGWCDLCCAAFARCLGLLNSFSGGRAS